MKQILIAVAIALAVSIVLTPALIRLFTRRGFGHEIREDGPASHQKKRGTPSMGGVAIIAGISPSTDGLIRNPGDRPCLRWCSRKRVQNSWC